MTQYEKNRQAFLDRQYIDSFIQLIDLREQDKDGETRVVDHIYTVDGTQIPIIKSENSKELWRINSAFYPEKEAVLWADRVLTRMNSTSLILLMGIGNGICAREIVNRMGEGNMLVIYEPNVTLLTDLMDTYDFADLIKRDNVNIVIDGIIHNALFQTIYAYWRLGEGEHCVTTAHPFYAKIFPEEFQRMIHAVRENVYDERYVMNTEIRFSENLIRNQFLHLPYLKKGYTLTSLSKVLPHDVPVILVCAGPSLDKNIEDLHAAKGKAIILVVDTAIRAVMAHGIVPDFIVSMEAGKPMKFFENEECRKIPLICLPSSGDELYQYHQGMKIMCNSDDFTEAACRASGIMPLGMSPGGCVATAAFASCLFMKMPNVILIGQDLSYSKEGVTHAGGHNEGGYKRREFYEVEGIDGGIVQSRHDWFAYLRWYVDTIELAGDSIHVVDATEGGAKITGTEIMTLREAVAKYCTKSVDIAECLLQIQPEAGEVERVKLQSFMEHTRVEMKSAIKTAKQAVTLCDQLLVEAKNNGATSKTAKDCNKKLSRCNQKILDMSIYALLDVQVSMYEKTMFEEKTISSDDSVIQERIDAYYDCRLLNRKMVKAGEFLLTIAKETGFGEEEKAGE